MSVAIVVQFKISWNRRESRRYSVIHISVYPALGRRQQLTMFGRTKLVHDIVTHSRDGDYTRECQEIPIIL